MAKAKPPFYIIRNFLSPKLCEQVIDSLGFFEPDKDPEGNPLKMVRHHERSEEMIFERFEPLIPNIEKYYEYDHLGTESISFEFYPQELVSEPLCENSNWVNRKWIRTKNRDISCVLFLSQYNDNPDFESYYEVYGGKLSYPSHHFGFLPERGTLIVYPSGPHFINATEEIKFGDMYQARFHLQGKLPLLYQPINFSGDYRTWFKDLM